MMKNVNPKSYCIAEQAVREAYRRVKSNRGAEGIDQITIKDFEQNLEGNLYKVWNRMSSGSYFPSAVRQVEIPKGKTEVRTLGIPTVSDRVAQMVTKLYLEPIIEPKFHDDSYGYRPNRSALDAVAMTKQRCWKYYWVVDIDIKGFFDHLDHDLIMKAVRFHTNIPWIILYIERWLKAPVYTVNETIEYRNQGSPQGSVISPLLANLFMHHAFDDWMQRNFPRIPFERYADDIVVHCKTEYQCRMILNQIAKRLAECNLTLHPTKTKIVQCLRGQQKRNKQYPIAFDFLGFTFQPRYSKSRTHKFFTGYQPAVSRKSQKKMRETMRSWKLTSFRTQWNLNQLAQFMNPYIRGWMNYFGACYKRPLIETLNHINYLLVIWARRKYKRFANSWRKARKWLRGISKRDPHLFAMWTVRIKP
tara:strand:+ start:693 stop:1946 length:1254 start_codon:yes stop_codon:yes gene_type:complete